MKTLLLVLGLADLASTIVVNNAAARCPLTDAEAEDKVSCGALKSRGIHFTAHPTECAAFVQCDGVTRATVMAVPEGTIWDNVVSTPVHLQAGSCAQSPCTTQRNISDCSSCFGYLTCKNNQVVSARCPDGQSFNRTRSQCAPDVTCVKGGIDATERLVSCVQIPNTNLYRKTAVLLGTQYNVDVSCSAGTVMNTTMCVCVSSNVRSEPGCERPTFELVLDTNRRTVILTVVTVEPKTTSVSAPIPVD
ncbi:hypothetical protein C0Q70_09088 [Pomacea canaliculata]|uniref:Chitin-binding type-2 domain-containing protein n=1 Tax=Pomacea canaliculata TaxID=400727 RepID=A0A2T7P8U7_POMCA|nr:hypothetical protein C0Q70_09088 [Pomacea canaliculata]